MIGRLLVNHSLCSRPEAVCGMMARGGVGVEGEHGGGRQVMKRSSAHWDCTAAYPYLGSHNAKHPELY